MGVYVSKICNVDGHPDQKLFNIFIWYWVFVYTIAALYMIVPMYSLFSMAPGPSESSFRKYFFLSQFAGLFFSLVGTVWALVRAYLRKEYTRLHRYFALPVIAFLLILALFVGSGI